MADIPLLVYPTDDDNDPTGEDRWANLVVGAPNGVVWPTRGQGSLAPSGDSTGMRVKLTSGTVMIKNFIGDLLTGQYITIDNPDSQNRYDLIVARLDLSGSKAAIALHVIKGTPSATNPAVPTAVASTDVPIAQVLVRKSPNATIAATDVVGARLWTGDSAWADVGTITVRIAASDTNTGVGTVSSLQARYRIENGMMHFKYRVTVNVYGYPQALYLGLPNPTKNYTVFTAHVSEHSVACHATTIDVSPDITWAYVRLTDIQVFDSSWVGPISSGSPRQADIWIDGTYEMAG